ncbi:hypothetical protein [Rhodohalobacter mucosus]|uniref:Uncharacterized protein n=1 Tax=Rhodohalobacter mucosus TaxID=2079485 RepID=A0A316TQA4_9BACT|nr:hypothetical protein [Rhodohalobacter mucosus]PWN05851.1 hypothetical protein DDZ15_11720 [Rhodohalobacter mucosus]
MKTLIKLILIIIAILLGEQQLQAQNANNQIDSQIRIAESILEEIFKSPDSNARNFFPGGQKLVQGEYIPGIGVHFKIDISQSRFYMDRDSSKTISGSVVTKEWVEERMLEYYNGYAAQLRSVPDREQVRITYGSDTINRSVFIIGRRQEISYESPETITAWASMSDIKAYASGNLSERQFRERLTIQDISEQDERRDLNIFASVLETAMNSAETEHLRVRREPTYEYLPGYGVHYHVRVGTGSSFSFGILEDIAVDLDEADLEDFDIEIDLGDIDVDQNRFEFDLDSMDISIQRMADSMKVYAEGIRIDTAQLRQHAEQARQQAEQMRQRFELRIAERDSVDLSGDAELMMDELIQTMRDYSGTLASLEEDQLLVITLHWEGRNPSLPERTQIRIIKGDLQRGAEPEIEEIRRR